MSRICLCLTGDIIETNLEQCRRYDGHYDLLELRADFLFRAAFDLTNKDEQLIRQVAEFPQKVSTPVILTLRKASDGGVFPGADQQRDLFLERILQTAALTSRGFAFVDLEDDADERLYQIARQLDVKIISSFHNFDEIPENLCERMIVAAERGDIPKAAVFITGTAELCELIRGHREIAAAGIEEYILVGMGDFGYPSRILAGKLGSFLTYSSPVAKSEEHGVLQPASAAPGHTDPFTLDSVFSYRDLGASTRIFGIVGNPVLHSKSPDIHNAGFRELQIDAVYVPFPVDAIKNFFRLADELDIRGVSVTMPHKEDVIPLLNEVSDSVKAIGACNTIYRYSNGWRGSNTDAPGFIAPLIEMAAATGDPSRPLAGKRVTVIGAGGAARAVVYALKQAGCDVCILNRTIRKAERLAGDFHCSFESLGNHIEYNDIIVQTTSLGMHPHEDEDPIRQYRFGGNEIVYEIIYIPKITKMLQRAQEAGCRIVTGDRMLLEQAYLQFQVFTGKDYPGNLRNS